MTRSRRSLAASGVTVLLAVVALAPLPDVVGKWAGLSMAFVACTLLAYAVIRLVAPDDPVLESALGLYDTQQPEVDDEHHGAVAETRIVRRAVGVVEHLAERRNMLAKMEKLLEGADLPFRPGETLFFSLAAVALLGTLALLLAPSPILGALLAGVVAVAPVTVLRHMAKRRRKKFVTQLPGTLQMLSGSLRAGYSLMQGVEAVSHEVGDPMGRELRRVTVEARLGRPLEEALDDAADRLESPDFRWTVLAIRIQREVGGNLSQLLQTVGGTMMERRRLKREVDALTAEGKISAIVLGLLPVGLGASIYILNKSYIMVLFTELVGQILLGGAVVMAVVGFAWMKKIIKIEM